MVDVIREIPGGAARANPRTGDVAQTGASTRALTEARSATATLGVTGAMRAGASAWLASPCAAPVDRQRVAQVAELISTHAVASRANAGAQWLATLHASASTALASLSRWRDGDPASQSQARRTLDALVVQWDARERASLGTVDDRLHFDAQGRTPKRFTVEGVAPAQWRASATGQITLFPAGPYRAGVEIDVANAVSQAGLRRRTARALAAYGITLEPPPPERSWVMSAPGAAWPSLASRFAIAQTASSASQQAMAGGADGVARRATLREAPDAIAPQSWRVDGADAVAQTRRALASMVHAIREAHTLARNTARASAQAVGRAAGSAGHAAANDSAYATAIASANAWATRLGKQPPFVALTLAMPGGVPVSRANVRALLADS
ncbi:hypothetical protein PEP31012_02603 [Pandoraea eparura]|uniref:Uncharacterized protein n=1 Tax=Pandoraea eparura TaxID=2508291 RepID=A0A5E4VGI7_9BURK|nr:hypothetical protein [Pandoraea eparura]VVE10459.1 hypothetical protein PEP31012_02603 [Pandoraea eparura]